MNNFELNILIMCQRKSSPAKNQTWNNDAKISNDIIKNFISVHFGDLKPKLKIEHLVDNTPCNHCFQLGKTDAAVKKFVQNSYQKFDIV